ncbi:MAG: IS630 family transposase [Rhodobacteraceae bacterium]|nr:IS630 family transposase [Paracoccaceae bacterium]
MPAAIAITHADCTYHHLRQMARKCRDANHSRRLPAIAGVMAGKVSRGDIAHRAGVGIQTLRDWIVRDDREGPAGLGDRPRQGRPPILGQGRLSTLKGWLDTGPPEGLAGWTVGVLKDIISRVFEVTISKEGLRLLIRRMGFCKLSPCPLHPKADREAQKAFRTGFRKIAMSRLPAGTDLSRVDVWFRDEARIGQKGMLSRVWACKGTRPRTPRDCRHGYCCLFSALCPARGGAIGHVCGRANAIGMNRPLEDVGSMVPRGRHALVIFDGAGWHRSRDLACPDNASVLRLPPHSPELNSAEDVFQFLKSNHCASRVIDATGDVKTRVAAAWEAFTGQSDRIQSIGHRSRAKVHWEMGAEKSCDWVWSIRYYLLVLV